MKKTVPYSLLFVTLLLPSVLLAKTLEVGDVVVRALDAFPDIKKSIEESKAAQAKVGQANSGNLPQVNGAINYANVYPQSTLNFATPNPVIAALQPNNNFPYYPKPLLFAPYNLFNAQMNAQYKLLDFGKTDKKVQSAKIMAEAAEKNVQLTKQEVTYQALRLFYGVLYTEEAIAAQRAEILDLEANLELEKNRVLAGRATEYDLLTTRSEISRSENQRLDLLNVLEQNKISLKRILALPEDSDLELEGALNFDLQKVSETDYKQLIQKGLDSRLEYQMAMAQEKATQARLEAMAKEYYPSLYLNGSYGGKNGYFPNIHAIRGNYAIGVSVNVPIFSGFLIDNQIKEAEANYRASRHRTESVVSEVRSEIRKSITDLNSKVDKAKNLETLVAQSEESLKRARIQHQNGLMTTTDLLDAETRLLRARLIRLQAIYDYTVARFALRKSVGDLLFKEYLEGKKDQTEVAQAAMIGSEEKK